MAPITLLNKGSLVARMGEEQSALDDMVPIDYIMDWFDKRIGNRVAADGMSDRVVVLLSKTGSGKSTSIAPNLYLRFFNRYRSSIVITQPRQLTAREIPKDIAGIPDYQKPNSEGLTIELYRNLGYQTMEFVKKPEEKGILFCTTGILLQFLKNMPAEQFCRRYRFAIVDEAHDRALDVDLILLLMKRLIGSTLNDNAPFLILMSATLNVQRFCRYFGTRTVFEVTGQSKPIDVRYPPVDVGDIYAKMREIIAQIDAYEEQNPPPLNVQDVIVFMPSTTYISKMAEMLLELNGSIEKKILPIQITAADVRGVTDNMRLLLETDPSKLFVPGSGESELAYRRVIIATPVAETGLTLPSLRYCVDTAMQLSVEFNPRHGLRVMATKPTTQSMSLQRKGRVGRKQPGVFFPLYTQETMDSMIVDDTPKIEVEEFTEHLLALIVSTDMPSLDRLPIWEMLTPPSDDSVRYSLERLFVLGAVDGRGQPTELGRMMNKFHKLSIEAVKMILSGLVFGAQLKELVCLACLLSIKKSDIIRSRRQSGVNPYDTVGLLRELDRPNKDFRRCDGTGFSRLKSQLLLGCEMLELLLVYQRFSAEASRVTTRALMEWCDAKGLDYYGLCRVTESIDEVYWQMLEQLRINPVSQTLEHEELYQTMLRGASDPDRAELVDAVIRLKRCIYEGYKCNALIWDAEANSFRASTGLLVAVRSQVASPLRPQQHGAAFKQSRPRVLVCKEIMTQADRRTGRFVHEAKVVSVMDGYVHPDLHFMQL